LVESVTNLTTGDVFRFTLAPRTNANWVLNSPATGTNWGGVNSIRMTVTPDNLANFDLAFDGAGGFTLVDTNGLSLGIGGWMNTTPGPGPDDISFSGMLTNGTSVASFSGVTDPSPFLVGLITELAMMFCASAYAVSRLACASIELTCGTECFLGNLPFGKQGVVVADLSFNWKKAFQSGDLFDCDARCHCECQ